MIANIVSFSRLVIAPFLFLFFVNDMFKATMACVIYAIIADFIDGPIARALNQASKTGVLLDILADKTCLYTMFLAFWWVGLLHENIMMNVILINWIVRDFILIIIYSRCDNFYSLMIGKVYTNLQALFVFLVVLAKIYGTMICVYTQSVFSLLFATVSILCILKYMKLR